MRKDSEGTWITADLIKAFIKLHQMGLAHSVEVWDGSRLVGGLYGLALGKVFFGESMFHFQSDASKVAMFYLTQFLASNDFKLIDAQQDTPHLRSLGAYTIDRKYFLELLSEWVSEDSLVGNWGDGSARKKRIEF